MKKSLLWPAGNLILNKKHNNKHKGPFAAYDAASSEKFCAEYLSKKHCKDIRLKNTISAKGNKTAYLMAKTSMEKSVKKYSIIKYSTDTKEGQEEVYNDITKYLDSLKIHSIENHGFYVKTSDYTEQTAGTARAKQKKSKGGTKSNMGSNTASGESLTCYFIQAVFKYGKQHFGFFTYDKLKEFENDVVAKKLKSVFSHLKGNTAFDDKNSQWQKFSYSCWLQACALYDQNFIDKSGYKLHHHDTDQFLKQKLDKHAVSLIKKDKMFGYLIGSDLWNPADVWAIKNNFDYKNLINAKSISELNKMLYVEFKKKNIIPISLKKINNYRITKAELDVYNLREFAKLNPPHRFKITQSRHKKGTLLLAAKKPVLNLYFDGTGVYKDKNFFHISNMQNYFRLEGKGSAVGKVGLKLDAGTMGIQIGRIIRDAGAGATTHGHLYRIIDKLGLSQKIPDIKKDSIIQANAEKMISEPHTYKYDSKTFYEITNIVTQNAYTKKSFDEEMSELTTKGLSIKANFATIMFGYFVSKLNHKEKDELFNAAAQWMEARSEFCAPFVKIY